MKKKQWAQSFSLIDEKYVEEADPMRDAGRVSAVRRLRRRIITLAACAAAVLLGLILFIPYRTEVPDVSRYADSEYYAVIQRLNDGQVIKPRYRNNLDYLLSKTLSKTDGDMNFATGGTGTANDGGRVRKPVPTGRRPTIRWRALLRVTCSSGPIPGYTTRMKTARCCAYIRSWGRILPCLAALT